MIYVEYYELVLGLKKTCPFKFSYLPSSIICYSKVFIWWLYIIRYKGKVHRAAENIFLVIMHLIIIIKMCLNCYSIIILNWAHHMACLVQIFKPL